MLSHHPRIACAPEFEFLVEACPDDERWPAAAAYREWLGTSRIFAPHAFDVDPELDTRALARSFVAQFDARAQKPLVGVTCHKHFGRLLALWPAARFVHLLRDGRDVARSCIGMGWAGNVWHGAERWIDAEAEWERVRARVPERDRIDVRYEQLVQRPALELARLCGFLGVEYDHAMLEYWRSSTYERPDPSLLMQWRRKLSADELGLLEARIGPLLRARGYPESGVAPARPGLVRRLALATQDRCARLAFRRRRYGTARLVRGRFARALGARALARRVQLECNAIDDRHVR
jgi:hypothetical protein